MNPEIKAALKASIRHWKRLVEIGKIENPRERLEKATLEGIGAEDCALCEMFYHPSLCEPYEDCEGCPVSDVTGRSVCQGTPYQAAYEYLMEDKGNPSAPAEELAFLESLLPKEEPK